MKYKFYLGLCDDGYLAISFMKMRWSKIKNDWEDPNWKKHDEFRISGLCPRAGKILCYMFGIKKLEVGELLQVTVLKPGKAKIKRCTT